MPSLSAKKRATLPNSAFAYVDSRGRRRLPINDKAHVRNALARFNQVAFEDDAARERARKRLLNAAKKHDIVPIGFITGQLQTERDRAVRQIRATAIDAAALPTGLVTLLMTDIEDSTGLLRRLEDRYRDLLNDIRGIIRGAVQRAGGHEIDARGDEVFAVFARAVDAVVAAATFQRTLGDRSWPENLAVRVRVGIHSGRPTLTDVGYIGLAVHTADRVRSAAQGGQILLSGEARIAVGAAAPSEIRFRSLGRRRLSGPEEPRVLFQIEADGLPASLPPLRTRRAGR